jgi:hypothetical protein
MKPSGRKRKDAGLLPARELPSKPATASGAATISGGPRTWWFAVLLFAVGFTLYSPSLSGPFVFDDYDLLEVWSSVRAGDLPSLWSSGRPVLMLTYVLNHHYSGFDPFWFHVTSVLLHCLNAFLLWRFLAALLAAGTLDEWVPQGLRPLLLYGVPLLFLTSPIQTESVAYISSRSEVLATTFYLSALWVFASKLRDRKRWLTAVLVMLLFAAAALSKQDKLTLPFAILLLDYLLLSKLDWRRMQDNWPTYALFAGGLVAGLLVVVRPFLYAPSAGFGLDWQTYLLTQFRMYFLYLRLLLVPFGLNADPDIAPSTSLWQHFSWLALVGLVAMIAASIYFHRRRPLIAFGALFFFLTLAPTSTFYPLLDFAAERRLYLPSIGFFLVLVVVLGLLFGPRSQALPATLAILVGVYSVGTFLRSRVWSDEFALWWDTVEKSPEKARPWTWLGRVYNDRKAFVQASQAWEKAEQLIEPESRQQADLLSNLGLAHANLGDHQTALSYYERAVEIAPEEPMFWGHLAVAHLRLGERKAGWAAFEEAFRHHRGEPELLRLRGQEYYQESRYLEAAEDLRRVLLLRPEDNVARRNLQAAEEMMRRKGIDFEAGK